MTLFFIKVDNRIVPFDLKITHISDEFFNKYSEGLQEINTNDSYISNNKESEIKNIKRIYKNSKEKYHLPNYGSLSKPELMEILEEQNSPEINQELSSIMSNRREMINEISQDIKPLEWWNHKYQGERLFSNNNRFLVFLVHKNSFKEGKDLKKTS